MPALSNDGLNRRIRRLCLAVFVVVVGAFAYCAAGVGLARWREGSRYVGQQYETVIVAVPFFAATSILAFLLLLSTTMRLLGRWQHEWAVVLALGIPAWCAVAFIVMVAFGAAIQF
jgi:hypothetical protein